MKIDCWMLLCAISQNNNNEDDDDEKIIYRSEKWSITKSLIE